MRRRKGGSRNYAWEIQINIEHMYLSFRNFLLVEAPHFYNVSKHRENVHLEVVSTFFSTTRSLLQVDRFVIILYGTL